MSQAKADLLLKAVFEFTGSTVTVTDREDVGGEVRVLAWGEIDLQMDQGEDHCELTLSNAVINGKAFSDNWAALQPPEGVRVSIYWSQTPIGAAPDFRAFFIGAITEVSSVTEQEVVVQIGDRLSSYERDIGDPITLTEFPQAAQSSIGKAKPVVLGTVKQWTPPLTRERKKSATKLELTASTAVPFDLPIESSKGWLTSGTVKIDDEHFTWTNNIATPADTLRITARAQNGTVAAAHDYGSIVTERAVQTWLIADHPAAAIPTVYAVSSDNKKVPLDASKYVLDLGTGSGTLGAKVSSVSLDDDSIPIPSDQPTYRRIEMDAVGVPQINGGFAFATPAKNQAAAAGKANQGTPNSFATLWWKVGDSLTLKRSAVVDAPKSPFTHAYLCVEHYGISEYGKKVVLAGEVTASQTTLTVDTTIPFVNKNTAPLVNKMIRCDKEDMLLTGINSAASTITVQRAYNGTTAAAHANGARVFVMENYAIGGVLTRYQPEIRCYLETGVGTAVFQNLGELYDYSDIPSIVEEEKETPEDAGSISAFHDHPVDSGVFSSGLYPTTSYNVADDKLQNIGALAVATIVAKASEDDKIAETLTKEVVRAFKLTSSKSKVRYIFNGAQTSLSTSWLQRIQALRFRVVHAASGAAGAAPTQIQVQLFIGSGQVSLLAFQGTAFNNGGIGQLTGPATSSFYVVDLQSLSPNGIYAIDLFSRNTSLIVSRTPSGDTDVYSVQVDAVFEEGQFVFNSTESLADRSVVAGTFDLVWNRGDSGYDNGVAGVKADVILPLMASQSHYYLLSDSAATFKVLGPGAVQSGLVLAASNASGTNETKKFDCQWTGIEAPSDSRVLAIIVTMDLAFLQNVNGTGFGTVKLVNDATGEEFVPGYQDWGTVPTNFAPNGDYLRTTFFWRWSFGANEPQSNSKTDITVGDLVKDYRVRFVASGTKTANETYINAIGYRVEVDSAGTQMAPATDAQQFTRISYFDVSSLLTDYSSIENRQVTVQFGKTAIDLAEKSKPILVHRVFWLFRFFDVADEPFNRVAVDMTGITLTDAVDSFRKVLTYGYPLLSMPTAAISETLFGIAKAAGALATSGVIADPTPARALLADLAEQARCSFFFWSGSPFAPTTSVATLAYKPDLLSLPAPLLTFSWFSGDMLPDSFELEYRTKDSVGNYVTISADPDYADGSFRVTSEKKWDASIALYTRRPRSLEANYLQTQTAADSLALQQLQYRYEREIVGRFLAPPGPSSLLVGRGFVIQIAHPRLSTVRAYVVGVRLAPHSLSEGVPPSIAVSAVILPAGIAGEAGGSPTLGGGGT